ncbi:MULTISPECIES: hypothetical protein [Alphaproteobacteria]|uniref:hypothetical protein n=1 Tax=Alphaproteobacteria TaxID=28211 RepID=UPI0011BD6087|nr:MULTISPECIES: hypothetical protein [Alphaproteobacteria]
MKSLDRTVALAACCVIVVLLVMFFGNDAFFEWAFRRHQNTLSWVVRPLLLLPLCYCAWRRSLGGVMFCVLAILSSMFWFPAPSAPRAEVQQFLAMEQSVLSGGWTPAIIASLAAIVLYGVALVLAFWRRSWRLGLAVAILGAGAKIFWSVAASPGAGHVVIPFALSGVVVLLITLLLFRRRLL